MTRRTYFVMLAVVCVGAAASFGVAVSADDNDNQENEQAVSLKDVPPVVKATILAEILCEVDGLELEEIERETEDGKTVYEVEFEFKNKEIELEIAADGKLLGKEVEIEDEGDEGDEGDEDDDEDDDDEDDDEDDDDGDDDDDEDEE